jgi:hypothetical protein
MTVPRALADDAKISGVWAVLNGIRFKATRIKPDGTVRLGYTGAGYPGHPAFSFDEAANAWIAVVPATDCDRVVEVAHRATYRGHECDVAEVDGTGVGLFLVRADQVTADELGFEMRERGVYWKFVDLTELSDYYDVQKDVFFPYWQQLTFGFAPNAGNWQRYVPDPDLPEVGYDRFRLGRFAVVNGIEQPAEGVTAAEALYEVSVLAGYHGEEYQVATIWPGGMATLRKTGDGNWAIGQGFTETVPGRFEKQAHVGTLYNYREIQRNLLFDQWLAEHAPA